MESESTHKHQYHNPENPHHESDEITQMRKFFDERGVEFSLTAQEYINLSDEELKSIIMECTKAIENNDQYIQNLEYSDYEPIEKQERIHQAKRVSFHLERRKLAAETILEAKSS